jgi:hypothetical protein
MSSSAYSVFIPRVFVNIDETRISDIFRNEFIGCVDHVDFVSKMDKDGTPYNMVYVYFSFLYNNDFAKRFKKDIDGSRGKTTLMYDTPWFWLILPNKSISQYITPTIGSVPDLVSNLFPNQCVLSTTTDVAPGLDYSRYQSQTSEFISIAPAMTCHDIVSVPIKVPPTMVPPHLIYGNRDTRQKSCPKRRLNNVPSYKDAIEERNKENK